jgi:hypothetical protein
MTSRSDGITDHGTVFFHRAELYQTTRDGVPQSVLRFINDTTHEAIACGVPRDPFAKLIVDTLLEAMTDAMVAMGADMTDVIEALTKDK